MAGGGSCGAGGLRCQARGGREGLVVKVREGFAVGTREEVMKMELGSWKVGK